MLAAGVHIGTKNLEASMQEYVHKRAASGLHIINLAKTWEKLLLAARVLVAIENPDDVCVVSSSAFGTRAAYKFGQYTGSAVVSGRYTPGTFTNQICRNYTEPRILLVTDPRSDSQPVNEASYVNIPVIAFCDTDSPLKCVDIAIPCNNKGKASLAVMYWLLTREVLRLRGTESRKQPWGVQIDLFIYKEPEEAEEEAMRNEQQQIARQKEAESAKQQSADLHNVYAQPQGDEDWNQNQNAPQQQIEDFSQARYQQPVQQPVGTEQQQFEQVPQQTDYQNTAPQQQQAPVQHQQQAQYQQQQQYQQQPQQHIQDWGAESYETPRG